MAEQVTAGGRRISLTKKQLETEIGAELLSLCQSVTSDGTLSEAELSGLREWMSSHSAEDLPAVAHLRGVLDRVLADGKISSEEFAEIHLALEAVLPPELRKGPRTARKEREKAEREALKVARADAKQKDREERARNRPIGSANFMVAGTRYEGRPEVIRSHVRVGEPATLERDRGNAYSRNAIAVYTSSGQQVGFIPEDWAADWAEELDRGAKVEAEFVKVLTGGRAPIPVVQAYLYGPDANVGKSASTAAVASDVYRGSALRGVVWLILIVAFVFSVVQSCT